MFLSFFFSLSLTFSEITMDFSPLDDLFNLCLTPKLCFFWNHFPYKQTGFCGKILETQVVFITLKRDAWNSWVAPPDSENSWHPKWPCRRRSKPCGFEPPRMVSRHTKTGGCGKASFLLGRTSFFWLYELMNDCVWLKIGRTWEEFDVSGLGI